MSVETDLFKALDALLPTWPTLAPQGTTALPRYTYQLISGSDDVTFDADDRGATRKRIQVDTWALDYPTARRYADAARAALYAALTVGEVTDNPSDYEPDTKLHRASFDIEAWE